MGGARVHEGDESTMGARARFGIDHLKAPLLKAIHFGANVLH